MLIQHKIAIIVWIPIGHMLHQKDTDLINDDMDGVKCSSGDCPLLVRMSLVVIKCLL